LLSPEALFSNQNASETIWLTVLPRPLTALMWWAREGEVGDEWRERKKKPLSEKTVFREGEREKEGWGKEREERHVRRGARTGKKEKGRGR